MIDYALIGQRLKRVRRDKNITQESMAEKMHVSVGYISQLERGITKINLETLGKISKITETDIAYFVSGSNAAQQNYAVEEVNALLTALNAEEREVLLHQIKSYIDFKNSKR